MFGLMDQLMNGWIIGEWLDCLIGWARMIGWIKGGIKYLNFTDLNEVMNDCMEKL